MLVKLEYKNLFNGFTSQKVIKRKKNKKNLNEKNYYIES